MKSTIKIFLLSFSILAFWGCEDDVIVDLGDTTPAIVIDAWIDNRSEAQTIALTMSKGFYDETDGFDSLPAATVVVENISDATERTYSFTETSSGIYQWTPEFDGDVFGIIGDTYKLTVNVSDHQFEAVSVLNPTAPIDSMNFTYEPETAFFDEFYYAQFFSVDITGIGTNYWIKGFYNGIFLNQPEFIITSTDGVFGESEEDENTFILPIRASINPDVTYEIGDVIGVELHGINEDARQYLSEISTQTLRDGGISELFSVPMTNLSGNITTVTGSEDALGFFSVSSVSISEIELTQALADKAQAEAR